MNWNSKESNSFNQWDPNNGYDETYNTINQGWTELMTSAPYGTTLRSMADANMASLNLYRIACRHIPALMNKSSLNKDFSYPMGKKHLAEWFRRAKNMRDLNEIAFLHVRAYEYVFSSIYQDIDACFFSRYLNDVPLDADQSRTTTGKLGTKGLNSFDKVRFANKSGFFRKFVKGVRPLMH